VTFDYSSLLERSRNTFAIAADRSRVSLEGEHLDDLARTVAFTRRALPAFKTKLSNLSRFFPRQLSAKGAHHLARRFREGLDMGFVEPLLNLPQILCERFNVLIFRNAPAPVAHASVLMEGYAFILLSGQVEPP
jgi:hypothetical protein